jgi:hypothetical protein
MSSQNIIVKKIESIADNANYEACYDPDYKTSLESYGYAKIALDLARKIKTGAIKAIKSSKDLIAVCDTLESYNACRTLGARGTEHSISELIDLRSTILEIEKDNSKTNERS